MGHEKDSTGGSVRKPPTSPSTNAEWFAFIYADMIAEHNALYAAIVAASIERLVTDKHLGDLHAFRDGAGRDCIQWNTTTHEASATHYPDAGWAVSCASESEGENYDVEATQDVQRLGRILIAIMCGSAP